MFEPPEGRRVSQRRPTDRRETAKNNFSDYVIVRARVDVADSFAVSRKPTQNHAVARHTAQIVKKLLLVLAWYVLSHFKTQHPIRPIITQIASKFRDRAMRCEFRSFGIAVNSPNLEAVAAQKRDIFSRAATNVQNLMCAIPVKESRQFLGQRFVERMRFSGTRKPRSCC